VVETLFPLQPHHPSASAAPAHHGANACPCSPLLTRRCHSGESRGHPESARILSRRTQVGPL
jgi:hypothetical protein